MARLIDGKAAALALRTEVARAVEGFVAERGLRPGLAVVIVGDHPASRAYVRTKTRMAEAAGIAARLIELPADIQTAALLERIGELDADPAVHGILVQLPLPETIDEAQVLLAVSPKKDVDGFHPANVGALFSATRPDPDRLLVPCTPLGCLHLLRQTLGAEGLRGQEAVIVGRSNIVGKPLAALLLAADCTVTVAHSRTRDLADVCRRADILVAAVGRPGLVRGSWVKPGAAVIDVGINRIEAEDGGSRLVGDVAFAEAEQVAGAITPVPGGVGPMTVACLMRNTLTAARLQSGAGG
ncbi:MAG TPA: bifunctional methylenetetrahydrofolate dehydrogenase/methenyltetrahydrofolate cyclohydrolase FolD [Geminicoccaceae bacterium]|nr:bifunctional methylenetetrahydrofolate dehydrogenase/methenyltetrahydrofolate cyclohydrolase FolD [Geminicoccaceae bacterium]